MIHYFAYGSNLHPVRLTERIPSARLLGSALLPGHRLAWHKRGMDASGKCFIRTTGQASDTVHGAIYRIAKEHKDLLDEFEGPGYRDGFISIDRKDGTVECLTYFARESHVGDELRPYHWYKQLVILGARYHGFPRAYIAEALDVPSVEDSDQARTRLYGELLARLEAHSRDD